MQQSVKSVLIYDRLFFQVCKSKMANAPGATHEGKRKNSGRKRQYERSNSAQLVWNHQHKQIYVTLTIFKSWKDTKNEAGYGSSTNSEFAAHYHWSTAEGVYSFIIFSVAFQ